MTVQTFRSLLSKRPFEPFRVVMSSGESYEVRHPEQAWLTRTTLYIGVDESGGVPDDAVFASLLHITAVESINGKKRRRSA